MAKVSFIMTARNEQYLERTVAEIYDKARGDFEVIVVQDGPPYQTLQNRPNLRNITGLQQGLKPNINMAAKLATGKYLLKFDAHVSMSEGIDVELQDCMQENWLVTPRFYVLDAKTWQWQDERFYDYMKLCCPLTDRKGYRFQAAGHWPERTKELLVDGMWIDDTMQMHGSGWFVDRKFFLEQIGGMSSVGYDTFGMEPPELCLKYWLGPWGGAVKVNKTVWYAHMHKGGQNPRGYELSNARIRASYDFAANYWMRNAWAKRAHDLEWLVDKFMPIPGWPENWRERQAEYERTHHWFAPRGSEAEERFYPGMDITQRILPQGERDMPSPTTAVSVPAQTPAEVTLSKLKALLPDLDVSHHSPNRPAEYRMSRHPRAGRPSLAKLFHDLSFRLGAEVGVEEGRYSSELVSVNPDSVIHGIDPWLAYERYSDTIEQDRNDGYYDAAMKRLADPIANGRYIVHRATSEESQAQFPDLSLDWVYIDGNHLFDYVVNDIIWWSRKVRPGGIIAGHDYKNEAKNHRIPFHVVQATNAYVDSYHIKPWFVLRGDKASSFFWVKP